MTPEPNSNVLFLTGFTEMLKYHMTTSGRERGSKRSGQGLSGKAPWRAAPAGWVVGWVRSTALHTVTTADHPSLETKTDFILGSSQILPPGGTQRLGPQQETGTPASGPSTGHTPPFQHTRLPQTGGCRHPGLWDQWTRRVTVTASAPRRTQVGPACRLPNPGHQAGPHHGLTLFQGHIQIVQPFI